jgi:putative flippase GtrA
VDTTPEIVPNRLGCRCAFRRRRGSLCQDAAKIICATMPKSDQLTIRNELRSIAHNQFVRFLLAGGTAAAANFLSRFLFSQFVPYVPAITLAFVVGLLTGFTLMRAYVFLGGAGKPARQASYFLVVNVAALAVTIAVSIVVARTASLVVPDGRFDEAVGHLAGVVAPVLLSFYAHKNLTFR